MYGEKFNGKPCPLGHTLRYIASGNCVECHSTNKKKSRNKVKKSKQESRNKFNPDDFTHCVFILGNPERVRN